MRIFVLYNYWSLYLFCILRKVFATHKPVSVGNKIGRNIPKLFTKVAKTQQTISKKHLKKVATEKYNIAAGLRHQAGLDFLLSKTNLKKLVYLVLTTLIIFTSWRCADSVNRYFDPKVKTQIVYKTLQEIKYPSITLCSKNLMKKSVVGSQLIFHYLMAFAVVPDDKDLINVALKVNLSNFITVYITSTFVFLKYLEFTNM